MSAQNRMVVDTRALATTGLTSSTTLVSHLTNIQGAILAVDSVGNNQRVSEAMKKLNELADALRRLKL